ncbi:MAG: hypothetical protein HYS09_02190 [Chloroflexi bacterium]|nr:hypothetical protein [Chloroflexota bacterium]
MPKRHRPPTKRRKRKIARARPNVALPPPLDETLDTPVAAVPRSPAVAPSLSPASQSHGRHVLRDYTYVLAELRRIVIVLAIVIGGLIAAAAGLRWF